MRRDATYRANIENTFQDYLKLVADLCRMSASARRPFPFAAAFPGVIAFDAARRTAGNFEFIHHFAFNLACISAVRLE
jgi:hypothetical protein